MSCKVILKIELDFDCPVSEGISTMSKIDRLVEELKPIQIVKSCTVEWPTAGMIMVNKDAFNTASKYIKKKKK